MRYSLLELTQAVLSSIGGDEINSISDTTEALDVVNIIKECYYEISGEMQPQGRQGIFHLDASTNPAKPCIMTIPTHAIQLDVLQYNTAASVTDPLLREVSYLRSADFLDYMDGIREAETWVDTQIVSVGGQDFNIKYRNDTWPTYYTSFDDRTLVFDSFDKSVENTLTSIRTYCTGPILTLFQLSNTWIPPLAPDQFQLLLQSAKAQASIEIRQTVNDKAERKERRNRALIYKRSSQADNRTELQKHNDRFGMGRRGYSDTGVLNDRTRNGT